MGAALEEFLEDFEALFEGEVREEQEAEMTPGKVTACPVSDPSVPGSSQNEIMLGGECGAPSDLVLGSPQDPDTISSDRFKPENCREVGDNINVNQWRDYFGHRNGYSPDVEVNLNPYKNDFNVGANTRRGLKQLDNLKDSVCLSSHRNRKSNQKARMGQVPIPRPCAHCPLVIGSRALMRQHIQAEHQDLLLMRRRSRQDVETEMKVAAEDKE